MKKTVVADVPGVSDAVKAELHTAACKYLIERFNSGKATAQDYKLWLWMVKYSKWPEDSKA